MKMAHERDIAKINKDHRENTDRLVEQLRKDLAELQKKHEQLLKEKEEGQSAGSAQMSGGDLELATAGLKSEVEKSEERCQELEKLLADQKAAYEVLLDTIKEKEMATEELEAQLKTLQEMNKQVHQ